MESQHIQSCILEFSRSFDDSRFPAAFLRDYESVECLGSNALNETLLVRHRMTGELAVAKCYTTQPSDACGEGDLLRRLRHPALPAFIAEYKADGMTCVVRQYMRGVTLSDAAKQKQFSNEEILRFGIALCDVLEYLHGQTPPIIHRDIKPENIILREDGSLALIDLGISREFDQNAKADTQRLGTLSFAPPEQYGFTQTDSRSDIFSLGMVLGFLLTGSTDFSTVPASIASKSLRKIIERCIAFAPKDRYANAAALRRALTAQLPPAKMRRRLIACALGVVLVAGVALGANALISASPSFSEPLIEQAVRLQLGKPADAPITKEELQSVETLCIFGDVAAADQDGFYAAAADWYSAGMKTKGSIQSLEDVALLPSLRTLCVAAQQISDLSPLEQLPLLEKVELKHNEIKNISVLSKLPALVSVGLNENPISDASPLAACKRLRFLDLCSVPGYDPAFLDALGDFEFLDIANATDSYAHLKSRAIRELKIGYSSFDTLEYLSDVTGLHALEVKHSKLTSLSGIEVHTELTYLNIAGCAMKDLSPVLLLPNLQT
ncbi:MAG: protein kinase, partial [Eubacteriales bacterium]|nr:protein kinase [Eubacteriales bacterium]